MYEEYNNVLDLSLHPIDYLQHPLKECLSVKYGILITVIKFWEGMSKYCCAEQPSAGLEKEITEGK